MKSYSRAPPGRTAHNPGSISRYVAPSCANRSRKDSRSSRVTISNPCKRVQADLRGLTRLCFDSRRCTHTTTDGDNSPVEAELTASSAIGEVAVGGRERYRARHRHHRKHHSIDATFAAVLAVPPAGGIGSAPTLDRNAAWRGTGLHPRCGFRFGHRRIRAGSKSGGHPEPIMALSRSEAGNPPHRS